MTGNMRVLALDIECAAASSWHYGLFNQNIGIGSIRSHPYILGWATRWVGEPAKSCTYRWADEPGAYEDLWDQLDQATHVLHYNGKRFDMPWINTEFKRLNVRDGKPPSPYKNIDLMLQIRKNFRLISNKLDYSSRALSHLEGKIPASALTLFIQLQSDDPKVVAKARRDMERYCIQDVNLLPKMYQDLLPWLSGINANLYNADQHTDACPNCGSTKLQWRGWAYTAVSQYPRFTCTKCGKWGRGSARTRGVATQEAR